MSLHFDFEPFVARVRRSEMAERRVCNGRIDEWAFSVTSFDGLVLQVTKGGIRISEK